MKQLLIYLLMIFSLSSVGQMADSSCIKEYKNKVNSPPNFSLGSKKWGLGFGRFCEYSGLRLSIFDQACGFNGIQFYGIGDPNSEKIINGAEFGLLSFSEKTNGLSFGLLGGGVMKKLNGFGFLGIFGFVLNSNGLTVGGGGLLSYRLSGISIASLVLITEYEKGIGVTCLIHTIDSVANGISISGLSLKAEKMNGLSIAPLNRNEFGNGIQIGVINMASQLNGVQLGLLNIIQENNAIFRVLPLININFRRNPNLKIEKDSINVNGDTIRCVYTYYPNGQLKNERYYKDSISINEHINYYKSGQVYEIKSYQNGKLNGSNKLFYKNGQLRQNVIYTDGIECSDYVIYDKKGRIKFHVYVKKDKSK